MNILFTILKFFIANFLLVIISMNLLGYIIRGLFQPHFKNRFALNKNIFDNKSIEQGLWFSLLGSVLTASLFYFIYEYIDKGIALSIVLLMISRLPDLTMEIVNGYKTSKRNMVNNFINFIYTFIGIVAFVLFNYSFYIYLQKI